MCLPVIDICTGLFLWSSLIYGSFGRLAISFNDASSGVACDLDSRGFHVLCKATEEVVGHVKPYSITGTLPLIRDLQVFTLFPFAFHEFFYHQLTLCLFTIGRRL